MAFRLGEHVVCGEIINTHKNSVHGWLGLRGVEQPVMLQLTGNCDSDLAGRHIRFEARSAPKDNQDSSSLQPDSERENESDRDRLERLNLTGLAWQQIGPTGAMTAAHRVRTADCSVEELCMRLRLKEPPPMRWVRCLYLEWYSQNGRVVVEMPDPIIEFLGPDGKAEPETADSTEDKTPEEPPPQVQGGLSVTAFHRNDEGEVEITDETPYLDAEEDDDGDNPYKLVSDDLQRELDAQTRETDRALRNDAESDDLIRDVEVMDEAIEKGERVPLGSLFDEVMKLPKPDRLTEQQAEVELKGLLTRLAMFGVALNMCEHFTALDAYRLLVEHLCKEEVAFAEVCNTGWVQHFDTAEFCEACQAEFDRQYEQQQRGRPDDEDDDDAGGAADGDMPF